MKSEWSISKEIVEIILQKKTGGVSNLFVFKKKCIDDSYTEKKTWLFYRTSKPYFIG